MERINDPQLHRDVLKGQLKDVQISEVTFKSRIAKGRYSSVFLVEVRGEPHVLKVVSKMHPVLWRISMSPLYKLITRHSITVCLLLMGEIGINFISVS